MFNFTEIARQIEPMDLSKKIWQWLLLILLGFIWGSSFILMKKGLLVYSHDEVAALRISISYLALLPFSIYYLKTVPKKNFKHLFVVGVFGSGIPAFLFTIAETQLSSALAGMLNSLTPFFTFILGVFIFKVAVQKEKTIGVIIGLIGAIVLVTSNGINVNNSQLSYSFFVVAATICYSISVNTIKKHLQNVHSVAITSISFLFIGIPAIIYLFTTNFVATTTLNLESSLAIFYIAILAIFGTALSIIIFNNIIKHTSALFASSVTYLIPIFAIFWGVVDGETINALQTIAIGVILIGIYFINRKKL